MRYGPMKPVGLTAPDGRRPWAVVQLRQENLAKSHFNLVGFQSRMKWGEQERVLRLIPGLENARFVRFGQIHRNTFINAPTHLDKLYRVKADAAGAARRADHRGRGLSRIGGDGARRSASICPWRRQGREPEPFPATTALGALARHLTESDPKHFQPANINYGLFEELPERVRRGDRRAAYAERARAALVAWAERNGVPAQIEAEVAAP